MMKKGKWILVFIFFSSLFYSCGIFHTTYDTPDALCEQMVKCICENDSNKLCDLIISKEELSYAINKMFPNETEDQKLKRLDWLQQAKIETKKGLDEIRKSGEKDGFDWKQTIFMSSDGETENENGIEFMKVTAKVETNGRLRSLFVCGIVKANKGWKIQMGLSYPDND